MKKILIVEDNEGVRELLKEGLGHFDSEYIFHNAKDGIEAISKLKDLVPDLVLLDLQMPRKNGWDVASHIRNNFATKEIPIIFVTVSDDETSKGLAKFAANAFIEKPFDIDKLYNKISRLL